MQGFLPGSVPQVDDEVDDLVEVEARVNKFMETRVCSDGYRRGCVAKTWQQRRQSPSTTNADNHVCAGQPHNAVDDQQHPLSVPRFPWYY